MLKHAHIPNTVDIQPSVFYAQAITIDIANRIKPALALVARKSWFFTGFAAAKEAVKCFLQAAQSLLNRSKVNPSGITIEGADRLQLLGLVQIADAFAVCLPGKAALRQCVIVQRPMNFYDAPKQVALFRCWVKPIAVRKQHKLGMLLVFNIPLDGFRRHMTSGTDAITSAPQGWQTAFKQPLRRSALVA